MRKGNDHSLHTKLIIADSEVVSSDFDCNHQVFIVITNIDRFNFKPEELLKPITTIQNSNNFHSSTDNPSFIAIDTLLPLQSHNQPLLSFGSFRFGLRLERFACALGS